MATEDITKALPFDAVEDVCNEIGIMVSTIEAACMNAIFRTHESSNFNSEENLWMIRYVARTIGMAADHLIGGNMRGGVEGWLELPSLKQPESGVSDFPGQKPPDRGEGPGKADSSIFADHFIDAIPEWLPLRDQLVKTFEEMSPGHQEIIMKSVRQHYEEGES